MCGIAGILNYSNNPEAFKAIEKMTPALKHRGPDDAGIEKLDFIAMGHTRLSIIDISQSGHQPMSDETKQYWIVFNGEIYNYKELRKYLIQHYKFNSTSDTEVLLYGYIHWGIDILQKIRGMFAFAIWDSKDKSLLLARDRIGEKPLIYCSHNNSFIFSSEINSLIESGIPLKLNKIALWHYFETLNSIPPPLTGYENIFKLEQGQYMMITPEKVEKKKYWNLDSYVDSNLSPEDWENIFYKKIDEVVKMELVADVPVGISLSGGVDSSVICTLSREVRPDIQTFSMITTDPDDPEKARIDEMVRISGLVNTQFVFNEHMDFEELIKLSQLYGEPYAHYPHLYVSFLYRNIRNYVKTIVTGNGADEVFAGYSGYQQVMQNWKYHIIQGITSMTKSKKMLADTFTQKLGTGIFKRNKRLFRKKFLEKTKPSEITQSYRHIFQDTSFDHFLMARLHLDLLYYHYHGVVQMHDTAAMKYGLELRSPFLDHELIEMSRKMSVNLLIGNVKDPNFNKFILKKSMEHKLPKSLLYAKKLGFGYQVDIYDSIKNHWQNRIAELFSRKRDLDCWIDKSALDALWKEFLNGSTRAGLYINSFIHLFSWYDFYRPELK